MNKKITHCNLNLLIYNVLSLGDPDRIRTCDPQLRRLLLYPAELPDQSLRFGARHGLISKVVAKVMLFFGFAINFIFYRIIVQVSVGACTFR